MRTSPHWLAVLGLAAASGCSLDLNLGAETPGEKGRLTFSYTGAAAFDCFFGCTLDSPMATGSIVHVGVFGADPARPLHAQTRSGVASVIGLRASYACGHDGTSHGVAADEPCASGESRDATYVATLRADRAGSFELRMLDADGGLVDEVAVRAEDPVDLQMTDGSNEVLSSSTLSVAVGATGIFRPELIGTSGRLAADDGVTWTIADPGVAAPGSRLLDLFGSSTDLIVSGLRPGTTRAILRLGDFERTVELEVVSP